VHRRYEKSKRRALLSIILLFAACSSGATGPDVEVGALGLQCRYGGIEVGDVSYTVMRSGVKVRDGSFVVHPNMRDEEFSAVIGPLPSGDNYTITLTARALRVKSGESSACTGAGGFSVAPKQTTVVAVPLSCGGLKERGPNDNHCPQIDSVRVVPSEIAVGSTLSLRADAHDSDRMFVPLTFEWTAREGILADETTSRASFTCTSAPSRPAITLKISDGDDTCPEESVTVYVKCRNPPGLGNAGTLGSTAGTLGGSAGTLGGSAGMLGSSAGAAGMFGGTAGTLGAAGMAGAGH
jgi:hypothetical protein